MVPPPTIIVSFTSLLPQPTFLKKSLAFSVDATTLIISPLLSTKLPFGMITSSPLSTAHISISDFIFLPTSIRLLPANILSSSILYSKSSTLPLPNVSISIADGNLKSLAISVDAAYSGFIVIASPSSFFINPIS